MTILTDFEANGGDRNPSPPSEKKIEWSGRQRAVFDFVRNGEGCANVNAVAGSGKSTTIVEAAKRFGGPALFVAFNRDIAKELIARVPPGTDARTLHSLGFRTLLKKYPDVTLGRWKTHEIADRILDGCRGDEFIEKRRLKTLLTHLTSFAKAAGFRITAPDDEENWTALWDHFGLDLEYGDQLESLGAGRLFGLASRMLDENNRTAPHKIDFDDQIYIPVLEGMDFPHPPITFVDEAQDVNPVQLEILKRVGGRITAVGDPRQAVYGFRGAGIGSMDRIAEEFGSVRLPLTVTYRCPKRIVNLAQRYAPELEAWDRAVDGAVESLGEYDYVNFDPNLKSQAVLCRNNAPLIRLYYKLWRDGIPAWIRGREEAKALVKLLEKAEEKSGRSDVSSAASWLVSHYQMMRESLTRKKRLSTLALLRERTLTLLVFLKSTDSRDSRGTDAVKSEIHRAFCEGNGICLSTIHRAKGQEWKRVYFLDKRLIPSMYAKQEWEREQERNLMYVGLTRTLGELYFIESPERDGEELPI